MNKLIFLIVIILTINNCLAAQTIKELDSKHGFKDFILGDDYSKWKSELSFLHDNPEDSSISYVYGGLAGRKAFDLEVKDIELKFFRNELVGIYLTTQFFHPEYQSGQYHNAEFPDFEALMYQFNSLFGAGIPFSAKDANGAFKVVWIGKTTILILQHDYQGILKGSRAYIMVKDKAHEVKTTKDGF